MCFLKFHEEKLILQVSARHAGLFHPKGSYYI